MTSLKIPLIFPCWDGSTPALGKREIFSGGKEGKRKREERKERKREREKGERWEKRREKFHLICKTMMIQCKFRSTMHALCMLACHFLEQILIFEAILYNCGMRYAKRYTCCKDLNSNQYYEAISATVYVFLSSPQLPNSWPPSCCCPWCH